MTGELSPIDKAKFVAAKQAAGMVEDGMRVGLGTGSTAAWLVRCLGEMVNEEGLRFTAVPTSTRTAELARELGIPVTSLDEAKWLDLTIDGADEFDADLNLIKGGGGAMTREKIVAAVAKTFVCIVDDSKQVDLLGEFPLPVEVIPMARSYVARELCKLDAEPVYRDGFVTDNGNQILDVHNLEITAAIALEEKINNLVGVVTNGLFAARPADIVLMGTRDGVETLTR